MDDVVLQAMALQHDQGIEIACNLLDAAQICPDDVLALCRSLVAAHSSGSIAASYHIGRSAADLLALARANCADL